MVAQASPTASRGFVLEAFGGATGTFTGLAGGRNIGITAGGDFSIRPRFGLEPGVEVRGTFPIHDGSIDSQKDVLGGLRFAHHFGRLQPYGDFLVGRGEIDYQNGGYPNPSGTLRYFATVSTVVSPGAGVNFNSGGHLGLKIDAQFQHWDTPVTTSGNLWSKAITIGANYRFNVGRLPGRRY